MTGKEGEGDCKKKCAIKIPYVVLTSFPDRLVVGTSPFRRGR